MLRHVGLHGAGRARRVLLRRERHVLSARDVVRRVRRGSLELRLGVFVIVVASEMRAVLGGLERRLQLQHGVRVLMLALFHGPNSSLPL